VARSEEREDRWLFTQVSTKRKNEEKYQIVNLQNIENVRPFQNTPKRLKELCHEIQPN